MPHPSRTIVFANGSNLTSTQTVICNVPEWATAYQGFISVGTVSGTSPTLDIKIEKGVRTPTTSDTVGLDAADGVYANYTWLPYAAFTQVTASTKITQFAVVGSGELEPTTWAASLAQPTAHTINAGPIGSVWKVTFTIAGTSPSFGAVKMAVTFLP